MAEGSAARREKEIRDAQTRIRNREMVTEWGCKFEGMDLDSETQRPSRRALEIPECCAAPKGRGCPHQQQRTNGLEWQGERQGRRYCGILRVSIKIAVNPAVTTALSFALPFQT